MQRSALIVLLLAVVLGAMTVFMVNNMLSDRSGEPIPVPPEQNVSKIVVATVSLQFGDELTSEKLKEAPWPADLIPVGSFQTIEEITTGDRRVALRSISRNEPIVKEKISGFGARASLSQIITEGHRAAAIRVDDVLSVGGFILPGDRVDVLHTYQSGKDRLTSVTNVIIQNVRVLAIDQLATETEEAAVVGKSATLELTQEQAQKVALANSVGRLSLTLRRLSNDDQDQDEQTGTVKVSDLKPAGVEEVVQPKPVKGKTTKYVYRKPAPKPDPFSDMLITRGLEQSEEKVRKTDAALAELAGGEG